MINKKNDSKIKEIITKLQEIRKKKKELREKENKLATELFKYENRK